MLGLGHQRCGEPPEKKDQAVPPPIKSRCGDHEPPLCHAPPVQFLKERVPAPRPGGQGPAVLPMSLARTVAPDLGQLRDGLGYLAYMRTRGGCQHQNRLRAFTRAGNPSPLPLVPEGGTTACLHGGTQGWAHERGPAPVRVSTKWEAALADELGRGLSSLIASHPPSWLLDMKPDLCQAQDYEHRSETSLRGFGFLCYK